MATLTAGAQLLEDLRVHGLQRKRRRIRHNRLKKEQKHDFLVHVSSRPKAQERPRDLFLMRIENSYVNAQRRILNHQETEAIVDSGEAALKTGLLQQLEKTLAHEQEVIVVDRNYYSLKNNGVEFQDVFNAGQVALTRRDVVNHGLKLFAEESASRGKSRVHVVDRDSELRALALIVRKE